jgi:large subunit ribosomal protein L1
MKKRSKRYKESFSTFDRAKRYSLNESIKLLGTFAKAKYDEAVTLSFQLGIRPEQSNEMVRGTVALPHGTGKKVRVLCFAKGEAQKAAETAEADYVGTDEFIKKITDGWLEFDAIVAHPDTMRDISKLGRVLGPRGLMPTPKTGTVTPDVAKAIKEIKAGRVEFKNDKTGGLHVRLGKRSFSNEALFENAKTIIKAIIDAKPQASKGDFIKRAHIASSQSPGVRLQSTSMGINEN